MRLCPSVEGSASPLITHRIGVDVCLARQVALYHKCHRCIYRDQAANWEPAESPLGMVNMHSAEEPTHLDVRPLEIGPPPSKRAPSKKTAAKKASRTIDAAS